MSATEAAAIRRATDAYSAALASRGVRFDGDFR